MIFYLDNQDKFLLEVNSVEVIFILHSGVNDKVMKTSSRWVHRDILKEDHLKTIISYLKSDTNATIKIGKAYLEESLKVKIHGEIIGWREFET